MNKDIEFLIDGKPFVTAKPELTVAEMLARAGYSSDRYSVVSDDGTEYREPETTIEIHTGDKFETKKRDDARPVGAVIHYKVNGEEQTTDQETLTVEQILRKAGAAASIDVKEIDSYFLEDISDGRKYQELAEQVALKEGDQFLAVHVGKTPVA